MVENKQIKLVQTQVSHLEHFFNFQLDAEASHMAAFTPKDPSNKAAYLEKFTKLLSDPTINMRTIMLGDAIVGSIAKYEIEGEAEITYWIDKPYWGRGVATRALNDFLTLETARPIGGRTANDNIGSQRVLERCGFVRVGTDKGYANARQAEIEEYVYKLE